MLWKKDQRNSSDKDRKYKY